MLVLVATCSSTFFQFFPYIFSASRNLTCSITDHLPFFCFPSAPWLEIALFLRSLRSFFLMDVALCKDGDILYYYWWNEPLRSFEPSSCQETRERFALWDLSLWCMLQLELSSKDSSWGLGSCYLKSSLSGLLLCSSAIRSLAIISSDYTIILVKVLLLPRCCDD